MKARLSRTAQAVVTLPTREEHTEDTGSVIRFPQGERLPHARQPSPKQERFAFLVGDQERSYTQAYREVYGTSKMSPETIRRRACDEAHKPHVAAMIRSHQEKKKLETPRDPERMKAVLTDLMFELAGDKTVQHKDRLKAMELLGKTVGLFADVVEHKGNIATDSEAMSALKERIAALGSAKPTKS